MTENFNQNEVHRTGETLGQYLRRVRKQIRRMSMTDVNQKTKISVGFISKIETDEALPSPATLQQLAQALGISHELPQLIRLRSARGKRRVELDTEDEKLIEYPRRAEASLEEDLNEFARHIAVNRSMNESYQGVIQSYLDLGQEQISCKELSGAHASFRAAEALADYLAAPIISISISKEVEQDYSRLAEAYLRLGEAFARGANPDFASSIRAYRITDNIAKRISDPTLQLRVNYRLARTFYNRAWAEHEYGEKVIYFHLAFEHCEAAYKISAEEKFEKLEDQLIQPYSCAVAGAILTSISDLLKNAPGPQTLKEARKVAASEFGRIASQKRDEARQLYESWIDRLSANRAEEPGNGVSQSAYIELIARLGLLYRGIELSKSDEERDFSLCIERLSQAIGLKYEQSKQDPTDANKRDLARYHQELGSTLIHTSEDDRLERALWQLLISARLHPTFDRFRNRDMRELMISVKDLDEKASVIQYVEDLLEEEDIGNIDYNLFYEQAISKGN